MTKIILDIDTCKECPFVKIERMYTADSWEMAFDWFCTKKHNKKIQGYVEWHEESKIEIPKWCPIKLGFSRGESNYASMNIGTNRKK